MGLGQGPGGRAFWTIPQALDPIAGGTEGRRYTQEEKTEAPGGGTGAVIGAMWPPAKDRWATRSWERQEGPSAPPRDGVGALTTA